MPIPIAPNTTPSDTAGAFAILAILADDNKFKKRLEELSAQAKSVEQILDNSKKADADAAKKLRDAERLSAELDRREADLKNRENGLGTARNQTLQLQEQLNLRTAKFDEDMEKRATLKEAGLTKWAGELTEKEKVLTAAMRDLEGERSAHKRASELTDRGLGERERELARREQAVKDGLAELEEKKADLKAKVDKLDQLRAALSNAA